MTCPPEIHDLLLKTLSQGILRTRAAAWSGDATRAAVEADHVHNLPGLLGHFTFEGLRFYLDVERPAYIRQAAITRADIGEFDAAWKRLEELTAHHAERALPASVGAR